VSLITLQGLAYPGRLLYGPKSSLIKIFLLLRLGFTLEDRLNLLFHVSIMAGGRGQSSPKNFKLYHYPGTPSLDKWKKIGYNSKLKLWRRIQDSGTGFGSQEKGFENAPTRATKDESRVAPPDNKSARGHEREKEFFKIARTMRECL